MWKNQRQDTLYVKTPPSKGPTTLAMLKTLNTRAVYIARFSSGMEKATMINMPEEMPAAPILATARPTMRAVDLGATPQVRELNSENNR